jgi:hypothetical protein
MRYSSQIEDNSPAEKGGTGPDATLTTPPQILVIDPMNRELWTILRDK